MQLGGEKIPQQKLTLSKKNKKWREACVEAFIDLSNQGVSKRRDYIKSLYDYYNGVIEKDDYRYVTDPYGKSRNNFPSKMRNYPIIKPIIDLLLGEKSKRPLNYTVAVLNEDVVSEKEKAKQELLTANLQQQFANKMIQMGIAPEQMEEQGVQMPEDLLKSFERSYVDNRAIIGQKSMNYILQAEEVYDKIQKAWFHYLISGEAYTERGVQNGRHRPAGQRV